jgi:hypothetical protein
MSSDTRFTPPATVIHQTIDLETVIINLDSGRYYSLNPSGSAIWLELLAFASPSEISASLVESNPTAATAIPDQVSEFVTELVREDLLAPVSVSARTASPPSPAHNVPYSPPFLDKYRDMEELIPLDPIHQVGALGWPHKESDAP